MRGVGGCLLPFGPTRIKRCYLANNFVNARPLQNHVLLVRWVLFRTGVSLFFIQISSFNRMVIYAPNFVRHGLPRNHVRLSTLGFGSSRAFRVLHLNIAVFKSDSYLPFRRRNWRRRAPTVASAELSSHTSPIAPTATCCSCSPWFFVLLFPHDENCAFIFATPVVVRLFSSCVSLVCAVQVSGRVGIIFVRERVTRLSADLYCQELVCRSLLATN